MSYTVSKMATTADEGVMDEAKCLYMEEWNHLDQADQ